MSSTIEVLVKRVELLEDYEAGSQALMEVVHREPATGARLASGILSSKAGDVHLRAFAFSMLYRADRAGAFEYIRENSGACEPGVFAAMLEEVAEDAGLQDGSAALRDAVTQLRSAIALRGDGDSEAVRRAVDAFREAYGG